MFRFSVPFGPFVVLLLLLFNQSLFSPCSVDASNILFFHVAGTASHRIAIWPLAEALADAGHNITYIFPMSKRIGSHPKIVELAPSKLVATVDSFIKEFDINIRLNNTMEGWMASGFSKTFEFCEQFYDSPEVHKWLDTPGIHFDLIMMDSGMGHCAYGLVYKFRAKHILFSPVSNMGYTWDGFGLVPESASVPDNLFHRKPGVVLEGLLGRALNTIAPLILRGVLVYTLQCFESTAREKLQLGEEMPSFLDIEKETSLVFHNSYFVEDYPSALPPMFVSYSGLHCSKREREKRKNLPEALASFIENKNTEGFVYISFGSATDMSTMPDAMRDEFFNAFAAFPKLNFLWRWGGSIPENTPKNLLLQNWFPQLAVLAHSKARAFITQAGRPSTQDALCYGVPMIAVPLFADQDFNADRLAQIGAAIHLDIESITTEKLVNALHLVTETDIYKERLKVLSFMFRDRPVDPLDNAMYWVEYVLKHNTSLLKPLGMDQSWWQRRLLDVYALIGVIFILFVSICLLIVALVYKCTRRIICGHSKPKVDRSKKIK